MKKLALAVSAVLFLTGCSTVSIATRSYQGPLHSIVILSPNREASFALQQELTASKFSIVADSEPVSGVIAPEDLDRLREAKVDSYLQLQVVDGPDGKPSNVTFQLVYTPNARVVLSGRWENLYNYQLARNNHSPADIAYYQQRRADLPRAMREVADELKRQIPTSFWQK